MASYLYQRGETFHFRLRVPQELHDRYPKPVIRKSLKTTDPRKLLDSPMRCSSSTKLY